MTTSRPPCDGNPQTKTFRTFYASSIPPLCICRRGASHDAMPDGTSACEPSAHGHFGEGGEDHPQNACDSPPRFPGGGGEPTCPHKPNVPLYCQCKPARPLTAKASAMAVVVVAFSWPPWPPSFTLFSPPPTSCSTHRPSGGWSGLNYDGVQASPSPPSRHKQQTTHWALEGDVCVDLGVWAEGELVAYEKAIAN